MGKLRSIGKSKSLTEYFTQGKRDKKIGNI